jgi:hypothetical protein
MADFSMNKAQIAGLKERAERMINRAKSITEKSEETVGQVVRSVEINGAAFVSGMAKGRFGNVEVMGVPVDLGIAGVGHALGFLGGGRYKEDVHNLSDGVLAGYSHTLGAGIGRRMATEMAARAIAGAPASALPGPAAVAGQQLTDAENEALRAAGLRR